MMKQVNLSEVIILVDDTKGKTEMIESLPEMFEEHCALYEAEHTTQVKALQSFFESMEYDYGLDLKLPQVREEQVV